MRQEHAPVSCGRAISASLREDNPEADIYLFYIDLRAPGRNEDFLKKREADEKLKLIKGKVAEIEEDAQSGDLTVVAEDIYSKTKYRQKVDMVVLATGMNPTMSEEKIPFDASLDQYGFFKENTAADNGIYFVGCAKAPTDVSSCIKEANGAALKAIQCIGRKEKS